MSGSPDAGLMSPYMDEQITVKPPPALNADGTIASQPASTTPFALVHRKERSFRSPEGTEVWSTAQVMVDDKPADDSNVQIDSGGVFLSILRKEEVNAHGGDDGAWMLWLS